MKGKIIKYIEKTSPFTTIEYEAIVLDYKNGYSIKKLWSDKIKFIDCPLVKIYWLREPSTKPYSAIRRMSIDWNLNPQYSFGFAENTNNYVINEWGEFKSEWYYLDTFEVIE